MAYHHPNRPHHPSPPTTCHCCCYPSPPPPVPQQKSEPFVQAVACHLTNLHNHQNQQSFLHSQQAVLSSIISRIEALELSHALHHKRFSLSSSHSQSRSSSYSSLRDSAARVIQTHFRHFLVGRSTTLRHLKDLACIKSSLNALKSSLSTQTHFDIDIFYRKAMDFLVRLDCIHGGDVMVRDGKRSVRRELVRFLEYLDEVGLRRSGESVVLVNKGLRFGDGRAKSSVVNLQRGDVGGGEMSKMKVLKEKVERMRKLSKGFRDDKRVSKIRVFSGGGDGDDDDEEEEEEEVEEEETIVVRRGKNGVSRVPVETVAKRRGVQSRPKKSVSFSNVHRVYKDDEEMVLDDCTDGSGSSDGSAEVEKLRNEVERMSNLLKNVENEETRIENGGRSSNEEAERNARMDKVNRDSKQNAKDDAPLLVSAPLPLKMES